jgi:hypothetical protein
MDCFQACHKIADHFGLIARPRFNLQGRLTQYEFLKPSGDTLHPEDDWEDRFTTVIFMIGPWWDFYDGGVSPEKLDKQYTQLRDDAYAMLKKLEKENKESI